MSESKEARKIVNSLRMGIPPERGVDRYSVGHDKLVAGVRRFLLDDIEELGEIRFVSGSWGSGKTHFFRLMRALAFENNCLVSNVELSTNEAPLNKFEKVFYSIVRNIDTPLRFESEIEYAAPFGGLIHESLGFLGTGNHQLGEEIDYESYDKARTRLASDKSIDIDFKKMIEHYWKTYLPDSPDEALREQHREEILQWFSGEGTVGRFRKEFGVNKIVSKENAKLMLRSLAAFVRLAGYRGLVILFDEAEQAYSIMRKSSLKDAHNNLLSLINNIEELKGLLMIYATTPDFFTDTKHGIVIYGALKGRIGDVKDKEPSALDIVWNLDAVNPDLADYQEAARRVTDIYADAYPDFSAIRPSEEEIQVFVRDLFERHSPLSPVRFWRVLVTALIRQLNALLEGGDMASAEEAYTDVIDDLREIE